MPAPLLVCFAVAEEAAAFRRHAAHDPRAALLVTGMGRRNAEQSITRHLRTHRPALVLTCGFAGGLDPSLPPGSLLYDAAENFPLQAALQQAGARQATFHCAERIATSVQEKQTLRQHTGAQAVEMESGWIRALCKTEGIPAATLRVITDAADEPLPLDFNRLLDNESRLRFGRIALALLRQPTALRGLLQLQQRSRQASNTLCRALLRAMAALPQPTPAPG